MGGGQIYKFLPNFSILKIFGCYLQILLLYLAKKSQNFQKSCKYLHVPVVSSTIDFLDVMEANVLKPQHARRILIYFVSIS